MVCSYWELGISEEHEGIILLEDDAPVGDAAGRFHGRHRPRSRRAAEHGPLPVDDRRGPRGGRADRRSSSSCRRPACRRPDQPIDGKVRVEIEDPKLVGAYAAALIQGVTIGPAPGWMQRRLTVCGHAAHQQHRRHHQLRHARMGPTAARFRLRRPRQRAPAARRRRSRVRPARAGETLTTLDGQQAQTDARQPGHRRRRRARSPWRASWAELETEVTATTTNILLESANFDFVSIRRTMKHIQPAERGERPLQQGHPSGDVLPAVKRAAELMRQPRRRHRLPGAGRLLSRRRCRRRSSS